MLNFIFTFVAPTFLDNSLDVAHIKLLYTQFNCLYRRHAPMFSSALPLNVPCPKLIPIANGVTVDSTRHGCVPRGHSELPQWTGEQDGTDDEPTDIKSSTMQGSVMRSSHEEKNCFEWRLFCPVASSDRLKSAARVMNDPMDNSEVMSSSRLLLLLLLEPSFCAFVSSSSSPEPSTSSYSSGRAVVDVVVVVVVFVAVAFGLASFIAGTGIWSCCGGMPPFGIPLNGTPFGTTFRQRKSQGI